ncbi:hypothetical protein ACS0TY_003649 [Phlomoides rotata]
MILQIFIDELLNARLSSAGLRLKQVSGSAYLETDSADYQEFDDLSLPFNVNDSGEMLLYGVLAQGAAKESSETDSHPNCKEEEVDSAVKKERI